MIGTESYPEERAFGAGWRRQVGGTEILLIAAVVLIPLVIAVAVTLWTLEPAAQRAERSKRGRKRAISAESAASSSAEAPNGDPEYAEGAIQRDRPSGTP